MKNRLKFIGVTVLFSVIFIILIVVGLAVPIVNTYRIDPQSVDIYVAIGTLLLALATIVLAYISFLSIKENRRLQALYRVRSWAEKAIQLLTVPSPFNEKEAIELLKRNIHIVTAGSLGSLADAEALGGDIKQTVIKAVHDFNALVDKAGSADKFINFESLMKDLLGDFLDVIKSTSKL